MAAGSRSPPGDMTGNDVVEDVRQRHHLRVRFPRSAWDTLHASKLSGVYRAIGEDVEWDD